jgi:hypothetical protein
MTTRIFELDVQPSCPEHPPLFTFVSTRGRPGASAMLGSIVIHVLAVVLLSVTSSYLAWLHEDDFDWTKYRVEPIRLHLSDPIYFHAAAAEAPNAKPAPGSSQAGRVRAAAPPIRRPIASGIELPAPHEIAKDAPVVFQPDFRPDVAALPANLPPLAFWARRQPKATTPSPREVVVPGRTEAPAHAPGLAAPPVATVPNREEKLGDANVALPPAGGAAQLTIPNSTTTPLGLPSSKGSELATFEQSAGQPANVFALASERTSVKDVQLPRGLQNIPPSSAGDGGGAKQPAEGPTAYASTSPAPRQERNGNAPVKGRGPEIATGAAPEAGKSADPAPRSFAQSAPRSPADAASRSAPPEMIRIRRSPTGNFDFVVLQSAAHDDLSDVGVALTGNPVFTVYLGVGDQKEWLLEYCVPRPESQERNAYQINVDDSGSIVSPYAVVTVVPKAILGQGIANHIVFHGLLTAGGALRNMTGVDINNPVTRQMLDAFKEWQFRPAFRNQKAIDVEVLLVIPARS